MSACVSSQEELWEDLLYTALVRAAAERRLVERHMPGTPPSWSVAYNAACGRARLHLYNLAAREWPVPPMLVEMARVEGLI